MKENMSYEFDGLRENAFKRAVAGTNLLKTNNHQIINEAAKSCEIIRNQENSEFLLAECST